MSKRSNRQKHKAKATFARSKKSYPTQSEARWSLMNATGFKPHQLRNTKHTGTYWVWEMTE